MLFLCVVVSAAFFYVSIPDFLSLTSGRGRKNPAACCGKSVRKCSTTDPFTFTSPCGAVSQVGDGSFEVVSLGKPGVFGFFGPMLK